MAISFTKTNWQDRPSTATPITAAQLNRMEQGIEDCKGQANANETAIKANASEIQTIKSGITLGSISITDLLLLAHPVGSIYSSTASTSPQELFGGSWERIKGKFIWGIEDGETAGITGGEKTHYLTENEMPTHVHYYNSYQSGYPSQHEGDGSYKTPVRDLGDNLSEIAGTQTNGAGENQPHNNMPPYYGAYVWVRTA